MRSVNVRLPHRPPRISESCLSQSASWTTTPKRTRQNLIVRSAKSEAEVTNNRRLRSTYCTIEANYWQTGSIARPLCDSRATCYLPASIRNTALTNPVQCFVISKPRKTSLVSSIKRDDDFCRCIIWLQRTAADYRCLANWCPLVTQWQLETTRIQTAWKLL